MSTYTQRTDQFMASLDLPTEAEAWRVGGSVRNDIIGIRTKDADYVVRNTTLDQLRRALRKAHASPTKIQLRDGRHVGYRANRPGLGLVEIVLPRAERPIEVPENGNKRHAFEIIVDPTIPLDQDAIRRDFRMNAIYVNARNGKIRDPVLGANDILGRQINTTHADSFRDDPLRILRALRFVSVLGFQLSDETRAQMVKYAPDMAGGLTDKGVSGTALDEFEKLLMGDNVATALRLARDTGVLGEILPELKAMFGHDPQNSHHEYTTDEHTFCAIDIAAKMGCSLRVRWSLLFHDAGKPLVEWIGKDGFKHYYESKLVPGSLDHEVASARLARQALKRLNADRKTLRDVPILNERHMVPLGKVKPTKVRTWRAELGDDMLSDLLHHRLADVMSKGTVDYEDIKAVSRLEKIRLEALANNVPVSVNDLLVNGHDLMALGLRGSQIGSVQKQLLHEVVSQPERNDREWLLGRAEKLAPKA